MSLDKVADATGTRFGSPDGDLNMGEETVYQDETDLVVHLPQDAQISMVKDGSSVDKATTSEYTYRAKGHGVYRVEARLDGRPWIFTNPIYLRHS